MRLGGDEIDRRNTGPTGPIECDPRALGGCCICTCLVVLVLGLMSFAIVEPTEYGIRYDHLWQSIDPVPLLPGRRFIGFWSQAIVYPSVVKSIEFSSRGMVGEVQVTPPLRTRTSEGLDLTVHVAFQYKLKKEALKTMYESYKNGYKAVFTRRAVSVLLAAAGRFQAAEYWQRRKDIGTLMLDNLRDSFFDEADITGLQILLIDLPTVFETKIVETQVQEQILRTRKAQQEAVVARANIGVEVAEFDRQKVIIQNNATAYARLIEKTALAEAQKARLDVEQKVMQGVYDRIGLSANGLVSYQRGIAYQNLDSAQFIFGAEQAAAIMNINGGIKNQASVQQVDPGATAACKAKPPRRLSDSAAPRQEEEPSTGQALMEEPVVQNTEEYLPATPPWNITIHH